MQQWFSNIQSESGRQGLEDMAAKKIQSVYSLYCERNPNGKSHSKAASLTMVPPAKLNSSSPSPSKISKTQISNSKTSKSKTSRKTYTRQGNSIDEKIYRTATNLEWETAGKLLLMRPKSGANSILRRSPIVRNRAMCWQVLLGCLQYDGSSDKKKVNSASIATEWAKAAKKNKQLYQKALKEAAAETSPELNGNNTDTTNFEACTAANETKTTKKSKKSSKKASKKTEERETAHFDPLLTDFNQLDRHQEIEALRAEIRNDVERTFPEIPLFQIPHIKGIMERILFTYTQSNKKSRTISYRQGMNSLLAVLLLVHTRDAASKARGK